MSSWTALPGCVSTDCVPGVTAGATDSPEQSAWRERRLAARPEEREPLAGEPARNTGEPARQEEQRRRLQPQPRRRPAERTAGSARPAAAGRRIAGAARPAAAAGRIAGV